MQSRWWALGILTAIYTCHTIDRQVVAVVMEPIKREFELSDGETGFLGGMAHAIGFAITVIPLGLLVDRTRRSRLISVLVTLWSGLTMLGAFAGGAVSLALLRMGVGAAEGGASSSSTAMLADYFGPRERGLAYGIFYSSTAIGVGVIFLGGGYIASHYGWRTTFLVAGLPGILLGLLAYFTLKEPSRGAFDVPTAGSDIKPSFKAVLREIIAHRSLGLSIAGLAVGSMTTSGMWAWAISYFTRIHEIPIHEAGLILAIALGLVQGIGLPLFGRISDRVSQGRTDRIHLVTICGLFLTVPAAFLMFLAPTLFWATAGAMLLGLTTSAWLGQGFGSIAILSPPNARGSVFGITQLCTNLLGTGLGPLLAGVLSDAFGGGQGLTFALALMGSFNLVAAALFTLATHRLRLERAVLKASASRQDQASC